MEHSLAREFAQSMLNKFHLVDWQIAFTYNENYHGQCDYRRKTINLSKLHTTIQADIDVKDTILHEIAHALNYGDGHGAKWRATAYCLGATPRACFRKRA